MIAGNQKISQRQFGRMVMFDWAAKTVFLLPGLGAKLGTGSFLLSLAAGTLLAVGYGCLAGWIARRVKGDFFSYLKERIGKSGAMLLTLLYLIYAFCHTVFLLRLFGEIGQTFLLPETPQFLLMAVLLPVSAYLAVGGLEVRGRVAETIFPVFLWPLLFLFLWSVGKADRGHLVRGVLEPLSVLADTGLHSFFLFGGMGIFLYLSPFLRGRGRMGRTLMGVTAAMGISAAACAAAVTVVFGTSGLQEYPWPILSLMSSAEVPGGFLQRWDVVVTALLLLSCIPAAGAGLFYLPVLTGILCREMKFSRKMKFPGEMKFSREIQTQERERRPVRGKLSGRDVLLTAVLVYGAALGCRTCETARQLYLRIGSRICVPLAVLLTLLLAVLELRRERCTENRTMHRKHREECETEKGKA